MASYSLTVVDVFAQSGRVYVRFSDKTVVEFRSLADAKEYATRGVDKDLLRRLVLNRYFEVDPNGSNPSLIEGRTITATNESNTMVVVS